MEAVPAAWQALAEASSGRESCPIDAGMMADIVPASPWDLSNAPSILSPIGLAGRQRIMKR